MSDWERQTNRGLQSLGDAYQRGQIDCEQYRARRRLLLQGIGERRAVTQPNTVRAPLAVPTPAAAPPKAGRGRRRATGVFICAMIALGLIAWWWLWREGR